MALHAPRYQTRQRARSRALVAVGLNPHTTPSNELFTAKTKKGRRLSRGESKKEENEDTEEEDNQPVAGTVLQKPVPLYDPLAWPSSVGGKDKPRALVLFAGAGFSSVALALTGYQVTAVELDPRKCYLHSFMKPHCEVICSDVLHLTPAFLHSFKTIWASPPCQQRSVLRVSSKKEGVSSDAGYDFVGWCLKHLQHADVLWVENVESTNSKAQEGDWYHLFNSAQFTSMPLQCRPRYVGGKYPMPRTFRKQHRSYRRIRGIRFEPVYRPGDYRPDLEDRPNADLYNRDKLEYRATVTHSKRECRQLGIEPELGGVCPSLTASEWKCSMRAHFEKAASPFTTYKQYGSRFYGCVRVTLDQAAMHMGLPDGMPTEWRTKPDDFQESDAYWDRELYTAIGNAVPIPLAFGLAQASLFHTLDSKLHKYLQLDSEWVPYQQPFPKEWVDTTAAKPLEYQTATAAATGE